MMFPAGDHYAPHKTKVNTMLAVRSKDRGVTWGNPYVAFRNIDYNQHGFVALVPRGSKRIYSFGTQPIWGLYSPDNPAINENTPIGFFYSDDDGYTWTGPEIISPENDPGYIGMAVMQMCETSKGTWLLSTYDNNKIKEPQTVTQYILRSTDQGASWRLLPDGRPNGWSEPGLKCLGEGRVISAGDRILLLCRTPTGRLWALWSGDDGRTWTEPRPTPLVQPDAPPMLCLLSDGMTLCCLHHNRHHKTEYTGLNIFEPLQMKDRSEIWVSLSADFGETWSEPGFLFCNALYPDRKMPFFNHQCSYIDPFSDGGALHLSVPHRWQQALHLSIDESELRNLPKRDELLAL